MGDHRELKMSHRRIASVLLLLYATHPAAAQNPAADPYAGKEWVYRLPLGAGNFRPDGGVSWVETPTQGPQFLFKEAGRTPQYLELLDAGRGMRVRLHATYGE